jgi:N-acetylglucosamine kinase-like BadF-type ATPase
MPDCVLGLDGGGTKTQALILSLSGAVLGSGTAGPCNIAAVPLDVALDSVETATRLALESAGCAADSLRSVCIGVAGFSQGERREQFRTGLEPLFPHLPLSLEPDYAIALTGATAGMPGIIVIAGTGSVAFGRNARGETHRAGAYGYLIDDGGSGYGVGREALAAILRAADGTGPETTLTERIFDSQHFTSIAEIVPAVYGGALDRLSIAALAPQVSEAAQREGDPVARAILMRAGGALARLTEAVTQRLFPGAASLFPVAGVGSLWEAGGALTDVFDRSLARFAPAAARQKPLSSPAHGAARQALTLLG